MGFTTELVVLGPPSKLARGLFIGLAATTCALTPFLPAIVGASIGPPLRMAIDTAWVWLGTAAVTLVALAVTVRRARS